MNTVTAWWPRNDASSNCRASPTSSWTNCSRLYVGAEIGPHAPRSSGLSSGRQRERALVRFREPSASTGSQWTRLQGANCRNTHGGRDPGPSGCRRAGSMQVRGKVVVQSSRGCISTGASSLPNIVAGQHRFGVAIPSSRGLRQPQVRARSRNLGPEVSSNQIDECLELRPNLIISSSILARNVIDTRAVRDEEVHDVNSVEG
jgi:hypothetical protein